MGGKPVGVITACWTDMGRIPFTGYTRSAVTWTPSAILTGVWVEAWLIANQHELGLLQADRRWDSALGCSRLACLMMHAKFEPAVSSAI